MKVWKKLSAVALALVMVMALCVPAFAGNNAPQSLRDTDDGNKKIGTVGDKAVEHANVNEAVQIKKDITVYNTAIGNTNVNEPTATYTYTVTPVTEVESGDNAPSITDTEGIKVNAKTGILTALAVSSTTATTATTAQNETSVATTLAYSPTATTQFTASKTGSTNTKWVTFDFSNVVFTNGAGVYRYLITETISTTAGSDTKNDTAAYTASGIVKGTTGNQRYLDVYVKQAPADTFNDNETADKDKWDVYGYALFAATTEGNIDSSSYKTTGFVADQNKTADAYYTYNVTISKTLVNDSVKESNKFPFKVNFENDSVTAAVLPIVSANDNSKVTQPTLSAGAISTMDIESGMAIAHTGSITFTGIPHGTTLTIDEQNNVPGTTYTVTTAGGTTSESAGKNVVPNAWASSSNGWTAVTAVLGVKTSGDMNNDSDVTVAFTNTLTNISPTGVTLRYAPYLAMMGAGIVALPLSLRKKEEEL
jgi:hypothetical protein